MVSLPPVTIAKTTRADGVAQRVLHLCAQGEVATSVKGDEEIRRKSGPFDRHATGPYRSPVVPPSVLAMDTPLDATITAIRAAIGPGDDARALAARVLEALTANLPRVNDTLAMVPRHARTGADRSQLLHVEPDGSFSVVAMISRPGQATTVHDHTAWGVTAVIAGAEREEQFLLGGAGTSLELVATQEHEPGAATAFVPPGDIHRVTNVTSEVAISVHVYGADLGRTSSVRRSYDLPVHLDGHQMRS